MVGHRAQGEHQGRLVRVIHLTYLNGPDVERLALTDDEILAAVEAALAAQGRGETVIEPRVHLVPESSDKGALQHPARLREAAGHRGRKGRGRLRGQLGGRDCPRRWRCSTSSRRRRSRRARRAACRRVSRPASTCARSAPNGGPCALAPVVDHDLVHDVGAARARRRSSSRRGRRSAPGSIQAVRSSGSGSLEARGLDDDVGAAHARLPVVGRRATGLPRSRAAARRSASRLSGRRECTRISSKSKRRSSRRTFQ